MAPALAALLGGQAQAVFDAVNSSIGFIRANRLRPLGLTSASRSESLPGIPTLGEILPGYEGSSFVGIGAYRPILIVIADIPGCLVRAMG